jgi:hypothetical protein
LGDYLNHFFYHFRVLHLIQSGIVTYWTRIHSTIDKRKLKTLAEHNPITLSDVSLVFIGVLAGGLTIAIFGLVVEQFISRFQRWRRS